MGHLKPFHHNFPRQSPDFCFPSRVSIPEGILADRFQWCGCASTRAIHPGTDDAGHWWCQAKDWMANIYGKPINHTYLFLFWIGSIVWFTTINTFCVTFNSNIKQPFLLRNCPNNDKLFHVFVQTNYHPVKALSVRRIFIFRLLHWSSETQTDSEVERKRMYIWCGNGSCKRIGPSGW